jgi:hypothetical protein
MKSECERQQDTQVRTSSEPVSYPVGVDRSPRRELMFAGTSSAWASAFAWKMERYSGQRVDAQNAATAATTRNRVDIGNTSVLNYTHNGGSLTP